MPDARLRHAIYNTFAEGGIPLSAALSRQLRLPLDEIAGSLERLHAQHAIVLDPRTREPRMVLPFSSVPTPFAVEGGGRSWFANCAWDAFGLPIVVGVDALITTTCQDCEEPIMSGRALAAAISGARYLEVPDASHGLPISHAALTNATLREHFAK